MQSADLTARNYTGLLVSCLIVVFVLLVVVAINSYLIKRDHSFA